MRLFCFVFLLPSLLAHANSEIHFVHNDWEVSCDNSLTCRAAGYSYEGEEPTASILLTREAGENKSVTGQVGIGDYDNHELLKKLPDPFVISLYINDIGYGDVIINKSNLTSNLSTEQVIALIKSMKNKAKIEFVENDHNIIWHVSDNGAYAAFLKMDETQGRLNTPSAIVRKGNASNFNSYRPVKIPTIIIPKIPSTTKEDIIFVKNNASAIWESIVSSSSKVDDLSSCEFSENDYKLSEELTVNRLSESKLLISTDCWLGAYNSGAAYWIINQKAPYEPILITTDATDYDNGELSYSLKGRGLGDCWSYHSWAWNGKEFVDSGNYSTGMCRLITQGGIWQLPTLETNIVHK